MRKLASIRAVKSVSPIENADAIELVHIDGWQCVSRKGTFKPGDIGVYFEIDSFLPEEDSRFGFLKNSVTFNDTKGFRIKTLTLRGALSQGLLLPISDFPELQGLEIEEDVTDLLKIQKWEPPVPACLAGEIYGYIPGYIAKTDQDRIQNFWKTDNPFNDGRKWEVTVKLDGASAQYAWQTLDADNNSFLVCSRNLNIMPSEKNTLWKIARTYDLQNKLEKLGRQISIQGEVIGEGIQGNPEKLRGQDFYVFDIFDLEKHVHLGYKERREIVDSLGLKQVPFLEEREFDFKTLDEALDYAAGPSLNPNTSREGVVFKDVTGRQSFKIISNSYLLKHGG